MPFQGIEQPNIIQIDNQLRLRKYDGNYQQAYAWYQDDVVRKFSEGITDPNRHLDENWVAKKLNSLNKSGELYFIEVSENNDYIAIGDVTLLENNPPIEIGVGKYRGIGIGKKVMSALVKRAKEIGITKIYNTGCYEDNYASQKMLLSAGFKLVTHDKEKRRMVFEIDL
ncbi:MAG TPA: GNAT family protein [Clostridia bacterium]|nr:GNAT family protein [Clostridia bacterium]